VAVAIEMDFPGMTLDQYNQLLPKMGLAPGGATPPEAIAHWVAETDDGLHVVDIWDSREAFDRFTEEHLGPYSAEVGYTGTPEMRFYDVHNHLGRGLG
jgi:hypothetical protein